MRNMKTVSFDQLITLSRPSPKWVWNAQGQLIEVPANQPAYNHDPVTGEPLGFDVEPAATNHFTQWAVAGGSTDGSSTTTLVTEDNPFGLSQILKVTQSGTGSRFYIYQACAALENGNNTFTFCVKPGPGVVAIGAETSNTADMGFTYNVDTEEIQSKNPGNEVTFSKLKDGFIQFSVTVFNYPGTSELLIVRANPRDGIGGTADDYFFTTAWNYNHTDYFPGHIITDGSAVTRAADVPVIENVDTAEWFNADAFTLYAEVTPKEVGVLSPAVVLGATSRDRVILFFQNGEANAQVRGNQGITSISPAPAVQAGETYKFAVSYQPGEAHIGFNGVVQTAVNELDETPTTVAFGSLLNGTFRASLSVQNFRMEKRALTAAELQELTQ